MPINELETHPYLSIQITNFNDKENLSKYRKLIVGTFPIYAITSSHPIEETGLVKRANWTADAFMQYFYGSWGSHFWEMFSLTFDDIIPNTQEEAIDLVNKYNFLITDVFKETFRKGYSPLDSNLVAPVYNDTIVTLIQNSDNLKIIYFTSKTAKKEFCKIVDVPFINSVDNIETIFDKNYRLIVLISPAGGGRTVRHFFNDFPLTEAEQNLVNIGQRYAYAYRLRYYTHFLSLPVR